MDTKNAHLTHMTSTLINWQAIRSTLKPILAATELTTKTTHQKSGKTASQITIGTINLNFGSCKTAEDIVKVIITFYNYDVPDSTKNQIFETVKEDMAKNNGIFNVRRWLASVIILRPMSLEDKMQSLFEIIDSNGDGYLDANELFFGIKQFFIGVIRAIQYIVDNNLLEKVGIKDVNLEETREALKQLSEVYTEDKVKSIADKCIAAASKNKINISYQEWIDWFPNGAPEAFGSAKILFDPL
jgi:Ca2+-binding EF-hand superfamily protein